MHTNIIFLHNINLIITKFNDKKHKQATYQRKSYKKATSHLQGSLIFYSFFISYNSTPGGQLLLLSLEDRNKIKSFDRLIGDNSRYDNYREGDTDIGKSHEGIEIDCLDSVEVTVSYYGKGCKEYLVCKSSAYLHTEVGCDKDSQAYDQALGDEYLADILLDTAHSLDNADFINIRANTLNTEVNEEEYASNEDECHCYTKESVKDAETTLNVVNVTNET